MRPLVGGVFEPSTTALRLLSGYFWSSEALSAQGFPAAVAVTAEASVAAVAAEAVPTAAGAAESL